MDRDMLAPRYGTDDVGAAYDADDLGVMYDRDPLDVVRSHELRDVFNASIVRDTDHFFAHNRLDVLALLGNDIRLGNNPDNLAILARNRRSANLVFDQRFGE